jgi:hypothetical protein
MRLLSIVMALSYFPALTQYTAALYPNERLVQFVPEMLDVTSFPSSVGPRRTKGIYVPGLRVRSSQNDREGSGAGREDGGWRFRVGVL